MKATTIHFIRHGKVENPSHVVYERLDGFGLSELGRRQAQATAEYIAAGGLNNGLLPSVVAVFSSPLQRTCETAGFIVDAINGGRGESGELPLELRTDERIIEIENHFRGKNIKREALLPQNWKYFMNTRRPSYGESYQSVAQRMSDFLYEKVDEFAGQSVIAVSHEGPIWALRCLLMNGTPEHWLWSRNVPYVSITSFTVDTETHDVLSIRYADPAKGVGVESLL